MEKAIYIITNLINRKQYVGQSDNPQRRFIAHKNKAQNGEPGALYNAMRKYGVNQFTQEVIEWTVDYNNKEIYYINAYSTFYPQGYNLTLGGEDPPHKFGLEHHNGIYSNEIIKQVEDCLLHSNFTQLQIAEKLLVSPQLVTSVNIGQTHRKSIYNYPLRTESPYRLSLNAVEEIKWLLKETPYTMSQIGEYYGVSQGAIKLINIGNNYKDIKDSYPIRTFRGSKQTQPVETILVKRSTLTIDT